MAVRAQHAGMHLERQQNQPHTFLSVAAEENRREFLKFSEATIAAVAVRYTAGVRGSLPIYYIRKAR